MKKISEGHIILIIVLLVALLGIVLILLQSQELTGQAVLSKTTSTKNTLTKDTSSIKKTSSPFNQPVSSLPQPSPGDQESDARLVGCTSCAKELEYRAMEGMCGGTLDDTYRYEDAGLELNCIRSDIYEDYSFTGRAPIFNIGAKAKCQTPYNWIVSYGAECPSSSILTRIGPTTGAIRPYENSWTPMPLVGEVEANCQRVSAQPSQSGNAHMRIYITCVREKR